MKNTINLLSFTSGPLTFWEKFYIWSLTVGRYIIIITDLIVLLCFFYKFKLDNDIAGINTDINNNLSIAQANYTQAKTILTYQKKITTESFLLTHQLKGSNELSHTLSLIPSGINITSIQIDTNQDLTFVGSINGTSSQQLGVVQGFANTLRGDSMYGNVDLTNTSTVSASKVTNFTIVAQLNSQ